LSFQSCQDIGHVAIAQTTSFEYKPLKNTTITSLYKQHNNWLTGWLCKRLDCPQDAQDLAQDTFVRIIRSPQTVTKIREPHNYLLTIARGLTVDLFRRRTLEKQYKEALTNLPEFEWPSEEDNALILEALMEIDAMLDGLGEKTKQTFILSRFDGLTYPDIAQQLNISLRTVNNYMALAMEHCCLFRLQKKIK
jgi:RNA polymerase sigma-70 factor (ECF subfamily)